MERTNEYPYLSRTRIREFLETNDAAIRKKWGQNFLTDPNIIDKIIHVPKLDQISNADIICEIGPGLGALTHILGKWKKPLVLFEIDPKLIEHLKAQEYFIKEQILLIEGDVLENLHKVSEKKAFFYGNLPYYISSEILSTLLKSSTQITGGVFLLQKEFAERITKTNSSLSIFVRAFGTWTIHGQVSGNCFFPKPEAVSAILSFSPFSSPQLSGHQIETLEVLLRGFFWGKRKTLSKILDASPFLPDQKRKLWKEIISEECKNMNQRPEDLDAEVYYTLAKKCTISL